MGKRHESGIEHKGEFKMMKEITQRLRGRGIVFKGTIALAFSVLAVGLILGFANDAMDQSRTKVIDKVSTSTVEVKQSNGGDTIADLAEQLAPTVVNIKVAKVEKTGMQGFETPNGPFGEFFDRYFGQMPERDIPRRSEGAGSGVVISEDGYVLTNNHVIDGATKVTVILADKEEYEAEIIGADPKTDLAVLKIEGKGNFHAAPLGDSEALRVGEMVVAIGNPFGLSHTVTSGIVSAKGRVIGAGPYDDFIQTDASINPGNSGGPLFNKRGEVVGINTAINPSGQGIGFAVPINTAKPLLPQLINNGKVVRGYLGVTIQPVTKDLARALNLEETQGALVSDVVPGGPADEAGIESGDVILSFNGEEVNDSHELPLMVANTPVGDNARVVVERKGKEKILTVHVAELNSGSTGRMGTKSENKTRWGLQLQELTPQISQQLGFENTDGVLVSQVEPESPADYAGLRQGDVILKVNQVDVSSPNEVVDAFGKNKGDMVLLTIKRDDGKFYVALDKNRNS